MPSFTSYGVGGGGGYGGNAYGTKPAQIPLPDTLYKQTAGVAPLLPQLTTGAAGNIQSELNGNLSSGTIDLLKNASAERSVASGMPGSDFGENNYLKSLGLTSEGVSQKGIGDYLSFLTGVGSQQLSPETQVDVANRNANVAAAPDPAAAAAAQLSIYNQYMNPAGGTISKSGSKSPRPAGIYGVWNPTWQV